MTKGGGATAAPPLARTRSSRQTGARTRNRSTEVLRVQSAPAFFFNSARASLRRSTSRTRLVGSFGRR